MATKSIGKRIMAGRHLSLLVIAALGFSLLISSPSMAQTIAQTTGIFAINPLSARGKVSTAILTDQYVKGLFVTTGWSSIEAKEGVYDWSLFDGVLSQAAAYNKVVTIGVIAGYETPSWVYADGAQSFNFLWDNTGFGPSLCSVQSIPTPWDSVFLAKWQTFLQAMGTRYGSNSTLVSVMLYGLNFHSIETSLPVSNGQKLHGNGISCTGYNYPQLWQKAGYTRTKIENALATMQSDFKDAFPSTQLVAGLNPGGFPPIDQNGNFIARQTSDFQVPNDLMASGAATLGSQFSGGNGGLGATGATWSLLTDYASTVDTGYQTINPLGSKLTTAINAALDNGAGWLQLYSSDILLPVNEASLISASQLLR